MLTWIFLVSVILLYVLATVVPAAASIAVFVLMLLLMTGVLFSIYRVAVSLILFHKLPLDALLGWFVTVIVAYAVAQISPKPISELFMDYKIVFVFIHLVGVALGVGGATISDIFFFRFLSDLRISKWESKILHVLSEVIWVSLGLFWVSGIGLFLTNISGYLNSSKFMTKMIIIAVIMINGLVLNYYISPRLATISFKKSHKHMPGEMRRFRKVAFALGALSLTSWYLALILGMLRSIPLSVPVALGVYVLIVAGAITVSQFVENRMHKQGNKKS